MKKIRINYQVLLLIILAFVSGCNDIGTAKFDDVASGTNPSQNGGSPSPTPTPPSSTFSGLNSVGNKTDSTVTLNWSVHPNAYQYLLYDVTGTPSLVQAISNPATNSITLTGLTPDATYKYRLRITHNQGLVDDNMNDLTVVMNHAPTEPNTPTYHTPNVDHGTINKPTFTISGVKAGDVVKLYKDNASCNSAAVASGTVGVGQTSINLQLADALTIEDQIYTFYADATNANGYRSSCTAGIEYELQKPPCPDNYVPIIGNATLGTSDFCVAKYEMKCENSSNGTQCSGVPSVTNVAKSRADYTPWVNISANDAWTACNNLNGVESGTYALISNREWMTIARDLQTVPANWDGGVVGTNGISRGHSNGSSALAAAADTAPCTGTGGSCTDLTYHLNKRTHKLSNNSLVWDLAGNVHEWVDWNPNGTSYSSGPTGCGSSWSEFSATCGLLPANDYLPSPIYTSAQNFGRWYGISGGGVLRGGSWTDNTFVGIYMLYLGAGSNDMNSSFGFRCVHRP